MVLFSLVAAPPADSLAQTTWLFKRRSALSPNMNGPEQPGCLEMESNKGDQ